MGGEVLHLSTKAEFDTCLSKAGQGLVVVDFTATWCGPCKRIAPVFESLAFEFPHVTFAKVDVDENEETAMSCGVRSMPTFMFFKNRSAIHTVQGADENALRQGVDEHAGDKWSTMSGGMTLASSGAEATSSLDPETLKAAAAAAALARFAAAPLLQNPEAGASSAALPLSSSDPQPLSPSAPAQNPAQVEEDDGPVVAKITFLEDAVEGVAEATKKGNLLVVFIFGEFDDEAVDEMEAVWEDEQVRKAMSRRVTALQLPLDSEGGRQFAQIHSVTKTPSTYLLAPGAVVLKCLSGVLTPDTLSTSVAECKALIPKPALSEAEKKAKLDDALARARAKKAAESSEGEKASEIERRQAGKETASAIAKREEMLKDLAKDKERREKERDKQAAEEIRRKLAQDKAERMANKKSQSDSAASAKPPAPKEAVAPPKRDFDTANLQFRLFNGETIKHSFKADDALKAAFDWLDTHRTDGSNPYILLQNFPKRQYSLEQNGEQSLKELDLAPMSSLILIQHPDYKREGGEGGGGSGSGWFSSLISYVWGSSSDPAPQEVAESMPETQPQSQAGVENRSRGGMATMDSVRHQRPEGGEGDDKKQDFWNGNSTAFQQ